MFGLTATISLLSFLSEVFLRPQNTKTKSYFHGLQLECSPVCLCNKRSIQFNIMIILPHRGLPWKEKQNNDVFHEY